MKPRQTAIGVALILGVSNLNADHYGPNIPSLQSPEKDVKDYELIAKLKGFQVQVMVNEDADRKKLFYELSKAAKTLKEGDFFLLTFSGYGGIISNFGTSESQQVSATWCLYDGQILHSEMLQVLSSFQKGVNILVIADSSSIMTGTNFQGRPTLNGSHRMRALPLEIAETVYLENKDFYDGIYLSTMNPSTEISANLIWLSACQINQVAYETTYNGNLTAAIKHIWNGDLFEGNYLDIFREITLKLPALQSPLVQTFGEETSGFMQKKPFSI